MMRRKFVAIVIVMLVLLVLPLLLLIDPQIASVDRLDNTEVNELLNKLVVDDTVRDKCSFDYEILDGNGKVIYKSAEGLPDDIGRATSERYTMRDIKRDGKVTGKLLIRNNYEEVFKIALRKSKICVIICVASEGVIITGFLVWTYLSIIKPFDKMKRFATDISTGNLDAPLEMDRGNIFGAFTESFDIMRSELYDSRQKEYEAQRSKAELVAQLSHDIKTPVASIKAMGELLEAKSTEQKQKDKLHSIVSKADQIDVLVSNLFATTLTDLNNLEVCIADQESSALEVIIRDADHKDYIDAARLAPCIIECDLVRTTQVINNIINNSY